MKKKKIPCRGCILLPKCKQVCTPKTFLNYVRVFFGSESRIVFSFYKLMNKCSIIINYLEKNNLNKTYRELKRIYLNGK